MKKLIPIFLTLFLLLALPSGPVFGALVAYYQFGDNTNDSSGNSYNATLYGTGTYVTGKVGNALSFDGVNNYVTLPLSPITSTEGTVAGWVKYDAFQNWSRFFDFGVYEHDFYVSNITPGDNTLSAAFMFNSDRQATYISGVDLDKWYYLALVTSSTNGAAFYVYNTDGTLLGTTTLPSNKSFDDLYPGSNYYLGQSNWPGAALFKGAMDEVRIYNTALSQNEIQALASGVPLPGAIWLLGSGLLGLGGLAWRRRRQP